MFIEKNNVFTVYKLLSQQHVLKDLKIRQAQRKNWNEWQKDANIFVKQCQQYYDKSPGLFVSIIHPLHTLKI